MNDAGKEAKIPEEEGKNCRILPHAVVANVRATLDNASLKITRHVETVNHRLRRWSQACSHSVMSTLMEAMI